MDELAETPLNYLGSFDDEDPSYVIDEMEQKNLAKDLGVHFSEDSSLGQNAESINT